MQCQAIFLFKIWDQFRRHLLVGSVTDIRLLQSNPHLFKDSVREQVIVV